MKSAASRRTGLLAIGVFKLAKGILLLAVAFGALKLLHRDMAQVTAEWLNVLRVDPDNRHIHNVVTRLASVDERTLKELGVGTFFYAGVFLTEGIGLLLGKKWAEYFTTIVTGSFVPLEVYELARHFSPARLLFILINCAIVWYLVANLRRERIAKRRSVRLGGNGSRGTE